MSKGKTLAKIEVNSSVKLRGRAPSGYVKKILYNNWTFVQWTSETKGPKIVHLHELELTGSGS